MQELRLTLAGFVQTLESPGKFWN